MYYDPNNPIMPKNSELSTINKEEAIIPLTNLRRIVNPLNSINVKIKRLHPDAVIPKYATELAAGFDLVAVEDVIVEPGETAIVKTGLAVQLPPGYELQVCPRSGISAKTKLRISNSPGTIDADYRGEVGVIVDNISNPLYDVLPYAGAHVLEIVFGDTFTIDNKIIDEYYKKFTEGAYLIRKGDRIAQCVLSEVPRAVFVEVDELDETERGTGGFGSTGVNA